MQIGFSNRTIRNVKFQANKLCEQNVQTQGVTQIATDWQMSFVSGGVSTSYGCLF
jgi:hypothetical protein